MAENSLSLHFGLAEGRNADLEVIAAAALHWVEALRAASEAIEPGSQIRIELVDAKEGSLRLNTILQTIENQLERIQVGSGKYPRLRTLALALAVFVATQGYQATVNYISGPATVKLSDEDRKLLKNLIGKTSKSPAVAEESRKLFRALERDKSITEVGVADNPKGAPLHKVPRNQFAERGGLWMPEKDKQERTRWPVLEVTLVSPVLVAEPRSWKFQPDGLPAFSAVMRDQRFLDALKDNHVRERLRIGIPMTIRLKVVERNVGGTWSVTPKGRSVVEVLSPRVD